MTMMVAQDQQQQPAIADQSKALAKQLQSQIQMSTGGVLAPKNLQEAIEVAKLLAYSGMLPKQFSENPGAVIVAMQMGAEVGLSPLAALQNIAVINGRPSLWGDAALAVCMAHPQWGGIHEEGNGSAAKCTVWRKGQPQPVERVFTLEDAKTAGLANKDGPWRNYPKRMLQMRARGFALRDLFPDALRGLAIVEEQQDVIEGGELTPLTPGTHKFGFAPPSPAVVSDAPKHEEIKAPSKPLTDKEKAWRAKHPHKGMISQLPTDEEVALDQARLAKEAREEMEKIAAAEAKPEPGSDG